MRQKLPTLKPKEVISILLKAGFDERKNTGKHRVFKNPISNKIVPVPVHGSKDIKKGTLFSIIKQSGLTLEEFIQLR